VPDTFCSVLIHYVFSTKNREPWLEPAVRAKLWPYLGAIAKQHGSMPRGIGGVSDHVHLLLSASKNLSRAELARRLKAGSSFWIHETFPDLKGFAWQTGYAAFSVGVSQVADTIAYISSQVAHHRTRSFQEEYISFLRKHGYSDSLNPDASSRLSGTGTALGA
jgi:putative transposase